MFQYVSKTAYRREMAPNCVVLPTVLPVRKGYRIWAVLAHLLVALSWGLHKGSLSREHCVFSA